MTGIDVAVDTSVAVALATYDAIVALAARGHSVELTTRDKRAESTYETLAITYSIIAGQSRGERHAVKVTGDVASA